MSTRGNSQPIDAETLERLADIVARDLDGSLPQGTTFVFMLYGTADASGKVPVAFTTNGGRAQAERLAVELIEMIRKAPDDAFPEPGGNPRQ